MRFVSVRELRNRSAQIWRRLGREGDLVITSSGKPIAILSPVSEETLEERLAAVRRARAMAAVEAIQERSVRSGRGRTSPEDVDRAIRAVRKGRSR